jgi:PilZ domain
MCALQATGGSIEKVMGSDQWGFSRGVEMPALSQERRMMRRFDMRLPATIHITEQNLQTETQNVSARGVFFYLDRTLAPGTQLHVMLTFPPHITLTEAVRVRFRARVIRVEPPLPSMRTGIAAMIENYEFLRSTDSPDLLSVLEKK